MFTENISSSTPRFIETIRYQFGRLHLVDLHENRMKRTLRAQRQPSPLLSVLEQYGLKRMLEPYLIGLSAKECIKLRFTYDIDQLDTPTLVSYTPRLIKYVKLIDLPDTASYEYKWENRSLLEVEGLASEEEVLFVRNGLLTDTRFSNIVLRLSGELLTPECPLLHGVMREYLIGLGRIRTASLTPMHWVQAESYHFINAMLPLPEEI